MKIMLKTAALILALVAPRAAAADEKPITPVKLTIVLSRYQGEKKVSSLPYTLVINANGPKASLRMGSSVPIPSMTIAPKEGTPAVPVTSYQYRDVGINIDCTAASLDDGRYRLELSIDDSSVYGDESPSTKMGVQGAPSFRSFRITEQVVLKDGQSREFMAATDKVNGEVTRVEVSLAVVK